MTNLFTNIQDIRTRLVGTVLTGLFHIRLAGPQQIMGGQASLYYFSTVIEVDDKNRYALNSTEISVWENKEDVFPINKTNWNISKELEFIGRQIKNVVLDEYGCIYLLLDNEVLIYHSIDLGDELFVMNCHELFDKNGGFQTNL